jgi:hypothetical protein
VAITWEQIERRVKRLEKLGMGLALEDMLLRKDYLHENPLLYAETQAYLKAICDALAGVESARVVLAKARQRHRDEARGK